MASQGRVQCSVCDEWMEADLGPNLTPWHIKRGGRIECKGSRLDCKNFTGPANTKRKKHKR